MKINSMYFAKKTLVRCTLFAMALSTVGCETLMTDSAASKKKKKDSSWFSIKKKEYQTPQSMNVTWSHDILTLPGKAATRGFGGRFYFYDDKTKAIPVEGDMVVYGFDDTNQQQSTADLSQATKRFRFTAEQFTTHFTEGELGPSYSVWIPWDEAYGAPKKIMLIPTFLTKEGRIVRGSAANLNLPGITKNDPNEASVQQASVVTKQSISNRMIDKRNSDVSSPSSGLRSTTIQVPSNSLGRQSHSPQFSQNLSELQSQFPVAPSNVQPNQNWLNQPGSMNASIANQQNPSFQSNTVPATTSQIVQNGLNKPNANGWAVPQYAPMDWSGLLPHSAPNQFQVPTSQGVQPASFVTR